MNESPADFTPGQKVWFNGLKAKVLEQRNIDDVAKSPFRQWGVPVMVKCPVEKYYRFFTIAHHDALIPRGKRK